MSALEGVSALISKMKGEVKGLSEQVSREMAWGQVVNIRQRLANGLGVDDSSMSDYTSAYAEIKGRSGPRDLLATGSMLRAMQVKISGRSATIYFADGHSKLIAEAHQKRHPWFGVSPRDRQNLQILLQKIAKEVGL